MFVHVTLKEVHLYSDTPWTTSRC